MRTRKLGGLEVSAMGLGCMGMSFFDGAPPDAAEMTKLLRAAVDRGEHPLSGLDSRPEQSRHVTRRRSSVLAPIASTCCTSTASIRTCRSRMRPAPSRS